MTQRLYVDSDCALRTDDEVELPSSLSSVSTWSESLRFTQWPLLLSPKYIRNMRCAFPQYFEYVPTTIVAVLSRGAAVPAGEGVTSAMLHIT